MHSTPSDALTALTTTNLPRAGCRPTKRLFTRLWLLTVLVHQCHSHVPSRALAESLATVNHGLAQWHQMNRTWSC